MAADICIHQGEDGTVCGHPEEEHSEDQEVDLDGRPLGYSLFAFCASCVEADIVGSSHPFVPGWKCPTCDGSGYYWALWGESKGQSLPCLACADSPVRGYVRAE